MTLEELAPRIWYGELGVVELVEETLEGIRKHNPRLKAFITVLEERARSRAADLSRELKAGIYRGPLHGIPVAVKDIVAVEGVPMTAGSRILRGEVPARSAEVVRALESEGAVIVGTTNLHEFASGATNVNPHFGMPANPWKEGRVPGGSSGGSAVSVAAGLAPLAVGTDTSGSVRLPSALCGVVGLKALVSSRQQRWRLPSGSVAGRSGLPRALGLGHGCSPLEDVLIARAGPEVRPLQAPIVDRVSSQARIPALVGRGERGP
jgi:aspartyl-tRNA(Asn)/glutamyl-tRNA(Gln) amidotransferase subunit A